MQYKKFTLGTPDDTMRIVQMVNAALEKGQTGIKDLCSKIKDRISILTALTSERQPDVSIAIPAYNEGGASGEYSLLYALESIARLEIPEDLATELIVVNNCSSDDTGEIASACGANVISESTPGIQFARQAGLNAARGSIIYWTEADTMLHQDALSAMTKVFENPHVVGAFGHVTYREMNFSPWLYRFVADPVKSLLLPAEVNMVSGGNFAYRKDAATTIGYDTTISDGEDEAMANKLRKYGSVIFNPRASAVSSSRRLNHGVPLSERLSKIMLALRKAEIIAQGKDTTELVRKNAQRGRFERAPWASK